MRKTWPTVRLGEVLTQIWRTEKVDASASYRILGVRWYCEGLFTKDVKLGQAIGAKSLYRVASGDFVYNRLFAWKGSFAIADDVADGAYVSNEFPCFSIDSRRLDADFLWWYFCRERAWSKALGLSSGATPTSRNRLKERLFLEMEIPLPSLAEQRRVVERIELLASQIKEALQLRVEAASEADALIASASQGFFEPKKGWQTLSVGQFCEPPQYGYTESATDQAVGPRFLRITDIQEGRVDWERVPYCRCPNPEKYLLKPNDLVFARTGATTGKSFVIRECPTAVFASYLIRLRVKANVSAEYLYRYFQSPSYWSQIANEKEGTGQPNINGSKLARLKVPIAPPPEQLQIVAELEALQSQVDALKKLQLETSAELSALIPSVLDQMFDGES